MSTKWSTTNESTNTDWSTESDGPPAHTTWAAAVTSPSTVWTATDAADAAEPAPTPPAVTPLGVTQSVGLNGTNEYMEDSVDAAVGIANQWTVALWIKMQAATTNEVVFRIVETLTTNQIYFYKVAGGTMQVDIGISGKTWNLSETVFLDVWAHHVLTYDGTNTGSELTWYIDGVDRSADVTETVNNPLTMADAPGRSITLGSRHVPAGNEFEGLIHSCAIWSVLLTNITVAAIYAAGADTDLRVDFGASYGYEDDLEHYYIPGLNGTNGTTMSLDYGNGTDRDLTPTGVDATNLVSDVPS